MSSAEDKQRRLGKGLGALLPSRPASAPTPAPATPASPTKLPIDSLHPNAEQPRTEFNEEKLQELAASIRTYGIVQPIIVRKTESGYQIVAGERRWRAAKLAQLAQVPVVVQDHLTDYGLLEIALIENIQREDLNPIEAAAAFERLSKMGYSQEEIGRRTGKDRATIANLIRLLRLPKSVQDHVASGALSMGHARAILSLHGPDEQAALAEAAVAKGLSVRQVEHEAQVLLGDKESPKAKKKEAPADPNVKAAVDALERALGTRVRIVPVNHERGRIEIEYYTPSELDRLYYLLAGEER